MSATVSPIREPLVTGSKTYSQITEDICRPTESAPNITWVIAFLVAVSALAFGVFCIIWTIWFGIGTWDLNRTIGWGWDITNFVWWVGIGQDRKSTRLNSSHVAISYAVFCLKKKNIKY